MALSAACDLSVAGLLGLPVRHRGITLGHVADVIFDNDLERAVGVEVAGVGEESAFLPWPALEREDGALEVPLPVSLLAGPELEYYRALGIGFCALRDLPAVRTGKRLRELLDVFLGPGGVVERIAGRRGRTGPAEELRRGDRGLRLDPPGAALVSEP